MSLQRDKGEVQKFYLDEMQQALLNGMLAVQRHAR